MMRTVMRMMIMMRMVMNMMIMMEDGYEDDERWLYDYDEDGYEDDDYE